MFLETGSLGSEVADGSLRAVLTLSGQDPTWLTGLRSTLGSNRDSRRWVGDVLVELERRLDRNPALVPSLALLDRPPTLWLQATRIDRDDSEEKVTGDQSASDQTERSRSDDSWSTSEAACLAGTALAQLAAVRSLTSVGLDTAGSTPGAGGFGIVTGHSAGLASAWAVARHGSMVPVDAAVDVMLVLAMIGDEAIAHRWSVSAYRLDGPDPSTAPMLAVAGLSEPALATLLESSGATPAIALQNSWDRFVLSGAPADLASLRRRMTELDGVRTEAIGSPAAFHHEDLTDVTAAVTARLHRAGISMEGDLLVPLVDPADGTSLQGGDLTDQLVASLSSRPVRWADTLATITDATAGQAPVFIDPGPSTTTARMTDRALRGRGTHVLALGDRDGIRSLSLADERPDTPCDYRDFAPQMSADLDGRLRVSTRHTRWTGRSPAVLAGMTPTTVDTVIVAAAANAGHVAELAGGGQVSAAILTERLEELTERLHRGHEVTFNALFLDPYLWNLHLGRDRLVQRARAAGAPICGVTVSAGIPELDEAVELLEELNEAGIWLNAFKPGDENGVRKVLAIADATPHRVWLHLEGGLAGGHHAWSDLEQVLVATYHDIRARPNVALLVGGGVDSPERSAELLDGSWALSHSHTAMPVDGVLVGTAAMATAESTASDSVMAALVAAAGTDREVRPGAVQGGVTSGRSSLGADIHYLDNHASRVAALLEEVAGDGIKVAARHDEIADALAGTAKPWFGDLATMTYAQALERFVELCALGRHGRYEDGRWLDPSHRRLFLDLLRRFEARCCPVDHGSFPSLFADPADDPDQLDDPDKIVEQFVDTYPLAAVAEMEPTDVAHLVRLCDRPGKPVPFVVCIDSEVRRRYLADSLWQAHSDLWDADEVLVIPGPVAVAGISRAGEPVAELLDRFGNHALCGSADTTAAMTEPPLDATRRLLALPTVLSGGVHVPSPLTRMADGGTWSIDDDGSRVVASVDLGDEQLVVTGPCSPEGTVGVELRWPALDGLTGDGSLAFDVEISERAGVPVAEIDAASFERAQVGVMTMITTAAQRALGGPSALGDVLDSAMRLAWPAVFESLAETGASSGLIRLVHARHRARRVEAGDESRSCVAGEHLEPAGRRLFTWAKAGTVAFDDEFLVRRAPDEPSIGLDGPDVPDVPATSAVQNPGSSRVPTARLQVCRTDVRAPQRSDAFAVLTGDANPLHRSNLVARLAGLSGRIVHGMWTSATAQQAVVAEALDGDADRLVDWDLRFVDVVEPGAQVTVTAHRVAVDTGRRVLAVEVTSDGRTVAVGEALTTMPRTAYVFPGQGIQHRGMGRATRDRCAAAAAIWDRAERYCREQLGFSLKEVVDENPTELRVRVAGTPGSYDSQPVLHRHPEGVLHLTQFTQVAMATLAAAQVAELRQAGTFVEDAVLAGHSVGEYNALAAMGDVLPLEAVLGVVWARGSAMHDLVPRDSEGASGYRLAVVRPHLAGLDEAAACGLVEQVATDTGELCEVVNHNLRGRQYAVAGTTTALAELRDRLGDGSTPGRAPYLEVPGIDVPFHSRALAAGVAEFRSHLDRALPQEIDPARLIGRYVPNLHPLPFSLERDFVEGVSVTCGGRACTELLAEWDDISARPARLARQLLVELLAWQFASPVRWIETTDLLLAPTSNGGLGVERVIEVGVGSAPTLTGLTKAAVAADDLEVGVLNVELDETEVLEHTADPEPVEAADVSEDEDWDGDWDGDAPGPAVPADVGPAVTEAAVADAPVGLRDAVPALLALSSGVAIDQLGDDSIDQLVDGASSRRNQVLMDLGKELGIGAVDGAHELALSELLDRLGDHVRGHRHPGPVLAAMIDSGVATAVGRCGSTPSRVADRVRSVWGLGDGWVQRCRLEIALATRDGSSRRGGSLRSIDTDDADTLVDEALAAAATRLGLTLSKPTANVATGVDGAALNEVVTGIATAFDEATAAARAALSAATGVALDSRTDSATTDEVAADGAAAGTATSAGRLGELDAEHGAERADAVRSVFDPDRIQLFASSLAWARADLDRLANDPPAGTDADRLVTRLSRFSGTDERFDATVRWYLERVETDPAGRWPHDLPDQLARISAGGADDTGAAGRTASVDQTDATRSRTVLISGASPGSIGEAVVAELLAGGADVIALTSSLDAARRRSWRELERTHAGPGARLFVVPANLASFRDIDAVLDWLRAGGPSATHPGLPQVVVPFAAPSVLGDAADAGPRQEIELRVMLLGVERLVARCAELVGAHEGVLTAVLPMSPNHGLFGGDGAYGHAKAGLEVLAARRQAEHSRWGRWCHTVGVEIGWVRGTGLMGAHDRVAATVEEQLGIRTHDAETVGRRIAELCTPVDVPGEQRVDLTGGLGDVDAESFAAVVREAANLLGEEPGADDSALGSVEALALPRRRRQEHDATSEHGRPDPTIALEDMVVICGVAEIGPWGTSATRADAERHHELPATTIVELAARCGLVEWSVSGSSGAWVDAATGEEVDESDLVERYRAEVTARCGIRRNEDRHLDAQLRVFIERPVVLALASSADAERLAATTPGATVARSDDAWTVTLPAGTALNAPVSTPLPRSVTAAIPDGMQPTSFGVPAELAGAVDPIAAWNLATTAQAFRDAATSPEELVDHVDPSRVACTQGTGMGGMDSIRTLHLAPRFATAHANDVLQEALGNVPPAHAVQSFVGSTGAMIHPVAACATAAVSLELALDLVRAGKADVVVGGGFDDLGDEGIIGFAEMAATADDAALSAAGFDPAEMSRPGDRSRAGFIESQGGGSFVVCRASVAAELGLPVRAVVVHASSHGDGLQTSIPAPGKGALAAVRGGDASPLASALAAHGLCADDISVVSKHDTSTRANDPNEAEIHEQIQETLGRSAGNPLRVVSQKAVTGHAKGGSALWQMAGLCDLFDDAVVAGNPNLDSVDPLVQPGSHLVVDDRPLRLRAAPTAALFTSLGFGHVSVVGALAHPGVFEAAVRSELGDASLASYRSRAERRRRERDRLRRWELFGGAPAFERRVRT